MNIIPTTAPNAGADPTINALDAVHGITATGTAGAIPITSTTKIFLTGASAQAMTLATPVAGLPSAGGNDGMSITVIDTTGKAHTVTTAANKINTNKLTGTFGGTIGQFFTLNAYNGIWYVSASTGVTLS